MTTHRHNPNVTVRLQDGAGDDRISVCRGWLPMAVWEGVRVRVTSSRGLTVVERFAIECLLELGECRTTDLFEVASLPEELADWLMSSLVQQGIARGLGQGRFVPERKRCETALAQGSLPIECDEERTFLWFPETEEFVCLPDARALVLQLRGIHPVGQFPLPERWKRERRAKVLTDALESKRVYGHDVAAIHGIPDEAIIEREMCPAYYCSTVLPQNCAGQWTVVLRGYRRRRHRSDAGGAVSPDVKRELVEMQLTLPILARLIERWRTSLQSEAAAIQDQCASIGLATARDNGDTWAATLDGASARRLGERRLLAERLSLAVEIDREIEFAVPLILSPSDDSARRLVALDDVVRQLVAAPRAADAIASFCDCTTLARATVLDRLWRLSLFGKVYEIREAEDFGE